MEWLPGMRVLSPSEPELGIGRVLKGAISNAIDVSFDASATKRRYALKGLPLRRFHLSVGQEARAKSGEKFRIQEVTTEAGLLVYIGSRGERLVESELDPKNEDLGALEQFLIGQWTPHQAFRLREKAWQLKSQIQGSEARGLVGPKISLLPHQLYIAKQIASREKPRALLADEVGLGKTIEAGLIFSALRSIDRAGRVLILVPDSLRHQWLAEMYRRFNVLFSILNEDSETLAQTPLVIASLDFLLSNFHRAEEALGESWDLMIVDEAHHLEWNEEEPSPEWDIVKALSEQSSGLLLLTATPRSQGLESQFGLLHLVDPERFGSFDEFKHEAKDIRAVSELARDLDDKKDLPKTFKELKKKFPQDAELQALLEKTSDPSQLGQITEALVDRHGTGRILFRNRRERLKGFPRRKLHSIPLENKKDAAPMWLLEWIEQLGTQKALILCSSLETVKELDRLLQNKSGIKRALFHEELELLERDRQAAWFAQPNGAQILISSEVGGEGRNFQFCHKLVLFDLPKHPDLVEQRIGRLDRIGQGSEIEIYVPWRKDSADEVLFRWYHEGLHAFERSWNGLASVEEKFHDRLSQAMKNLKNVEVLIADTRKEAEKLEREQQESIDHLLDLNSFKPQVAAKLVDEINGLESKDLLRDYMEACFDYFGVDQEDFDELGSLKITPGSLMYVQNFPELNDEKVITFERKTALAREDFTYLTLDHPMVQGSLTLLLDHNQGRASASIVRGDEGGAQFEFLFIGQALAPLALEVEKFLAPLTFTECSNHLGEVLRFSFAESDLKTFPEAMMRPALSQLKDVVPKLLEKAQATAEKKFTQKKFQALKNAQDFYDREIARLGALARVNKSVSQLEIKLLNRKKEDTLRALSESQVRLDAIRMTVIQV